MRVIRYFKESAVPFRFFLLSLCLTAVAAQAQETVPTETSTTPAATDAAPAAPAADKPQAATVPLEASTLLSIGLPHSQAERDDMAERAATLKEESRLRREAADKAFADAKTVCWKKFLVSACLDDARVAYRKETSLAKRQERDAQSLERNVRKYDAAEHIRLRDEENARREAENAKKAADYRAKQEGKDKAKANK
jgi:hypothetical protein